MEQKPTEERCGTWVVVELWDNAPSVPGPRGVGQGQGRTLSSGVHCTE